MSNEMQRSAGSQRLVEVSGHEAPEATRCSMIYSQRMAVNLQIEQ
jgi:hypothetical protein